VKAESGNTLICRLCSHAMRLGANFCRRCGTKRTHLPASFMPLVNIPETGCIKCGAEHLEDDSFCFRCGWLVKDVDHVERGLTISAGSPRAQSFWYIRPDLPRSPVDLTRLSDYFCLEMRELSDEPVLADCSKFLDDYFARRRQSEEQLASLAAHAADGIYRTAADVTIIDRHAALFFETVVADLWERLARLSTRLIYVLANSLREDRLQAAVMLFRASGFIPWEGNRDGHAQAARGKPADLRHRAPAD
jgi:ribosomal protein L40E